MIQLISSNPVIPTIPSFNGEGYNGLVQSVSALYTWAKKLNKYLNDFQTQVSQSINTGISAVGPNLVAASTIIFTSPIHHITGSAAISTVQVPPNFAGGPVYLINDGSWSLITGGNIARAVTPASHQCICLVYDAKKTVELFYPTV